MHKIYREPLVFLHIPKTAGSALSRILRDDLASYGHPIGLTDSIFSKPFWARDYIDGKLRGDDWDKLKVFVGHSTYPYTQLIPNARLLTMLRKPDERAFSQYHQLRKERMGYYSNIAKDLSFSEFIREPELTGLVGNYQTRFLGIDVSLYELDGQPLKKIKSTHDTPEEELEEMYERAVSRLNTFFWIGTQERFARSVRYLRELLGFIDADYPQARGFRRPYRGIKFSEDDGKILDRLNEYDYKLWNYADKWLKDRI